MILQSLALFSAVVLSGEQNISLQNRSRPVSSTLVTLISFFLSVVSMPKLLPYLNILYYFNSLILLFLEVYIVANVVPFCLCVKIIVD